MTWQPELLGRGSRGYGEDTVNCCSNSVRRHWEFGRPPVRTFMLWTLPTDPCFFDSVLSPSLFLLLTIMFLHHCFPLQVCSSYHQFPSAITPFLDHDLLLY